MTLMNTKFELSLPGFMNIDFVNQIRKEEKIGGGGAAIIYKGIILDPKLIEVSFFFFFFFFFSNKIKKEIIKITPLTFFSLLKLEIWIQRCGNQTTC